MGTSEDGEQRDFERSAELQQAKDKAEFYKGLLVVMVVVFLVAGWQIRSNSDNTDSDRQACQTDRGYEDC